MNLKSYLQIIISTYSLYDLLILSLIFGLWYNVQSTYFEYLCDVIFGTCLGISIAKWGKMMHNSYTKWVNDVPYQLILCTMYEKNGDSKDNYKIRHYICKIKNVGSSSWSNNELNDNFGILEFHDFVRETFGEHSLNNSTLSTTTLTPCWQYWPITRIYQLLKPYNGWQIKCRDRLTMQDYHKYKTIYLNSYKFDQLKPNFLYTYQHFKKLCRMFGEDSREEF